MQKKGFTLLLVVICAVAILAGCTDKGDVAAKIYAANGEETGDLLNTIFYENAEELGGLDKLLNGGGEIYKTNFIDRSPDYILELIKADDDGNSAFVWIWEEDQKLIRQVMTKFFEDDEEEQYYCVLTAAEFKKLIDSNDSD